MPPSQSAGPPPVTCADEHRAVVERCAEVEAARAVATGAAEVVAGLRRQLDELERAVAEAEGDGAPARVEAAKDAAQASYHAAHARATTPAETESAAREWLATIDHLNATSRAAISRRDQAAAAIRALIPVIEVQTGEADGARVRAERAEETCTAARAALATCEEAATAQAAPAGAGAAIGSVAGAQPAPNGEAAREGGDLATRPPAFVPFLDGDPAIRDRLASGLAGGEAASAPRWADLLDRFAAAIAARAIEEAYLEFDPDAPFWSSFDAGDARLVARALGSLGYRIDGEGGWLDDRAPSQRELSLAVGFAGLDPMRVRRWPTDAEIANLPAGIRVAAADYLADAARTLALADVVEVAGRAGAGLDDLWDAWGLVRPLLISPA